MNTDSHRRNSAPDILTRTKSVSLDAGEHHLSTITEDIILPPHLLSAARGFNGQSRRRTASSDVRPMSWINGEYWLRTGWPVQSGEQARGNNAPRPDSAIVGSFVQSHIRGCDSAANNFVVEGPRRYEPRRTGTSLPVPTEDRGNFPPSSVYGPDADELVERYRNAVIALNIDAFSFNQVERAEDMESIPKDNKNYRQSICVDPLAIQIGPYRTVTHQNTLLGRVGSSRTVTRQNTLRGRAGSSACAALQTPQRHGSSVAASFRRTSIWAVYESAKTRGKHLQRKRWAQLLWEYSVYAILLSFIYFVLVGLPLWKGAVYWLYWLIAHDAVVPGVFSVIIIIAVICAFTPLFIFFEKDPPEHLFPAESDPENLSSVQNTALIIPCYKSANLIAATLKAALKTFPPSHIFVIANGDSPTPLDNTEEVAASYGVNYIWSPIGSKIVAQFVGCHAAKKFDNVLVIDDDCALPSNFPVVSDRLKGRVKCVGYAIKSVGPSSSKGTLCQQAQDLEYKLSGLQRALAGKMGSATFPHGAVSLWDRKTLIETFNKHPGFNVSEDWFFGHAARRLGCRIQMCSSVFVETETPSNLLWNGGGAERGGFGEMTVLSQRFKRWNFFFVNGLWYNMAYIFGSWKLGWWELGAKLFVLQEAYETLLYLGTPFVLPISFIVDPYFMGYLTAATLVLYYSNAIIFNELHLRRKNESCGFVVAYLYYMPYKILLTAVNIASCYWSLVKYARYFGQRHPKVIEDEKALEVVLRLEGDAHSAKAGTGRRMTVTAIAVPDTVLQESNGEKNVGPVPLDTSAVDFALRQQSRPVHYKLFPSQSCELPRTHSHQVPAQSYRARQVNVYRPRTQSSEARPLSYRSRPRARPLDVHRPRTQSSEARPLSYQPGVPEILERGDWFEKTML